MNVIRDAIHGMGFFEIISFLILGGFAPFALWFSGTDQLKKRFGNRFRGYLYKVGAIAIALAFAGLLAFFWRDIWNHVSTSFGPTLIGLLIATIACIALFPVGYLGSMARSYYKAREIVKSDRTKCIKAGVIRNILFGLLVLVIILLIVFFFLPIKMVFGVFGAVVIALLLGWWGAILRPDF